MLKRLIGVLVVSTTAHAMIFDNRFLPLLLKPFTRRYDASSHVRLQPFFMQADRAFSEGSRFNIPDIEGTYDSVSIANALVAAGFPHPLRSDFRFRNSIPWTRKGRIDVQGLAFLYELSLANFCGWHFSVGVNGLFAHISSRHEFFLQGADLQLPPGDREHLFAVKEKMHKELGICPPVFSKTGFGDTDFYLRAGSRWEYILKSRRIDAAFKLGVLAPTAARVDINNPAAIPLGGQRHWGIYGEYEGEIELKEDLTVGLLLRASKRFDKTQKQRMPVADEPSNFGAVVGPLKVDPGWTFVFNPYVSLEGLREGFGIKAQYTLVSHLKDCLTDVRSSAEQEKLPTFLTPMQARSSWGMEYVSVGAFYDFGRIRDCLYPKISAYWDIPVNWLVSKRASKTNSVSLMLEFDF